MISHVSGGTLQVVAFRLSADAFLPTGGQPALIIPVSAREGSGGAATLTLSTLVAGTLQAEAVPVTLTRTETAIPVVKSGAPRAFSLAGNRPNPFNPSTEIAYDAPQQAHIQVTVYNLLGQEVARLVDQVQAPGRYTVVWNARNAAGQPVSSGVYLYRLISSTGFTASRRMTLLK